MKEFIKSNKAVIFAFLFFLCLTIAAGVYLLKTPIKTNEPSHIAENENKNLLLEADENKTLLKNKTELKNKAEPIVSSSQENIAAPETTAQIEETGQKYALIIGEKKYEIFLPENSTVYNLMEGLKQKGEIDFQGRDFSGLGFFVEEINGIKNSSKDNTFWIYYINGKSANVGISNYILKNNDIITWKYEKSTF